MILENKHKNRRVRMVRKLVCYLELSFSDLCLRRYLLSIVKLNCLGSICFSMIPVSFVSHCYGYSRSLVRLIKTCGPPDECCTSRICDSLCKSWDKLHLIQCGLVCENDWWAIPAPALASTAQHCFILLDVFCIQSHV